MKVRVIAAGELDGDLRRTWSELQRGRASLASPYFSPAYVEAAASCRPGVRVGVIEDGGRCVGLLPFEAGRLRIGGPVGGRLSDFEAVIAPAGVTFAPELLVAACGLRLWRFDHMLCEQVEFAPHFEVTAGSPALDLRGGFQHYLTRQRSTRRCIERVLEKSREMARQHGDLEFEFDCRNSQVLEQIIRWKREQCRRTGVVDFFGVAANVALVHAVHACHTDDFAGALSVLRVGGRIAAAHFGMRSHDTLHYWFPAYERELGHYSPGLILLVELIRAAATAGLARLDLGKGEDRYKRSFCTHELQLGSGAVAASPLLARLRRWHGLGLRFLRTAPIAAPLRVPVRALRQQLRRLRTGGLPRSAEARRA